MGEVRKTVAIVDDDPAVLDSLKFLLNLSGYTARTFSSASAFLSDGPIGLGCLVLDQHMPQMTGIELATRLRNEKNSIPILLITGAPSPAIIARALIIGIEKVLEKPPSEDDLLEFVSTHI